MIEFKNKETQLTITLLWCLLAVILLGFTCNHIIDKDYLLLVFYALNVAIYFYIFYYHHNSCYKK